VPSGFADVPRFRSVLLICAANTARSVLAEHLLRRELRVRAADSLIELRSAGIAAYARDGALVSLDTRMALRDDGIALDDEAASTDLKRHPDLLDSADLVLAMTESQIADLNARFPSARNRLVTTFRAFAGETGDIEDPVEKGQHAFAECREEIKRLVSRVADRVLGGGQE
jgi:protein-tyrosine-phosphatase